MSRPVASTAHLVWATGHVVVLLSALRYLTSVVTLSASAMGRWYSLAYLGAILSYGIVCYKSFGVSDEKKLDVGWARQELATRCWHCKEDQQVPQASKAYLKRALMDENVQYLFIAIYWFMNKPIFVTLIPYATFSLFHVLTFVRTTIIPMVFPSPSRPAQPAGSAAPAPAGIAGKASDVIKSWVKANYDPAMRFVAYAELAVLIRVLFGAMLLRNSLIAPLLYAHFLRLRFYLSTFTRTAFQHVSGELDKATNHPSCPDVARKVYLTAKDLIGRYASSVLAVQNQRGPAGATGTAAPATGAGAAAAPAAGGPARPQ